MYLRLLKLRHSDTSLPAKERIWETEWNIHRSFVSFTCPPLDRIVVDRSGETWRPSSQTERSSWQASLF
jgi:hypothetical protein